MDKSYIFKHSINNRWSQNTLLLWFACLIVPEVDADTIATYAGTGVEGFNSDGIPAINSQLNPESKIAYIATDSEKTLYIADPDNHRVRKVDANSGIISTVAGTGASGNSGDGGLATAATLKGPLAVTVASNGDLYISDTSNNVVRKVTASTGIINQFGAAITAPRGMAIDNNGNLYVAAHDEHRVYKIDSGGNQTVFAGTGVATCGADGGAASASTLRYVHDVAVAADGNVYLAEPGCFKIRKIDVTTGLISTVAGTGASGNSGDGGLATAASLNEPRGLALDQLDNLYISVAGGEKLRRVDAVTRNITTFAGTGGTGSSGDGGDALFATMLYPLGVAVDCEGSVYFYDGGNFRVRKITLTSPTICGGSSNGSSNGGSDDIRYVPFASKYLLMALMALLGGWHVLKRR